MDTKQHAIELVSDGRVTWRNYRRLGYRRVVKGAYAKILNTESDRWELQRAQWFEKVRAVINLHPHVILYGATALQVLGVQLPERLQDWTRVHVLVTDQARRPHGQDVVAYCVTRRVEVWRSVDGLPVLHPVDHWLQMANSASLNEMVEIGDGFLRRRDPLMTLEQLFERLSQLKGARGVKLAYRASKLVRAETESLYETRTRLVLFDAGLPMPAVNVSVWCASARQMYHADMGYEAAHTAVEFDGLVHVGDRRQMGVDARRRRDFQDAGWIIITATADQLRQPDDFVRSVETALIMRTRR